MKVAGAGVWCLLLALQLFGSLSGSLQCDADACPSADNDEAVASSSVLQHRAIQTQSVRAEKEDDHDVASSQRSTAEDARFLMQASFGPTRESLSKLASMTYSDFVQEQMRMPVVTHREVYRTRVNPFNDARHAGRNPMVTSTPCNKGRFRNYVFTFRDVGKHVIVNGSESILIEGKIRTLLKPFPAASSWVGKAGYSGYVCTVFEGVGSDVILSTRQDCHWNHPKTAMDNPAIYMPGSSVDAPGQTEEVKQGVVVLKGGPGCSLEPPASDAPELIVIFDGEYYAYEDRLRLIGNSGGDDLAWEQGFCVPPNHVNEKHCRLGRLQQTNGTVNGVRVEVHTMPRAGHYLEDQTSSVLLSEFVAQTVNHPTIGFMNFPQQKTYVVMRLLTNMTVTQPGEYTLYLTSDDGSRLTVDGQQVIQNGGWHGMQTRSGVVTLGGTHTVQIDWYNGAGGMGCRLEWSGPESGGTREVVPSRVLSTFGKAFQGCDVSCGSPGEVASDPSKGHHMPIYPTAQFEYDNDYDNKYANRMHSSLAKSTVWTKQAMEAPDQLRQRTAWALSQILVVSVQGIGDDHVNEFWIGFYDTFIRHAFGNFREMLWEITFHPVMGRYLTHSYSSSYDYNRNMPNENYAREIMQLFTIGLDMLNPDGTKKLDAHGADIPTYTNENILTFARVFTGFKRQNRRNNVEWQHNSHNYHDFMQIDPAMHDKYPKPDLSGGYLGDGLPPCEDPLPQDAFLWKGARYVFAGLYATQVTELVSNSLLAAALCPGGQCPKAVVELNRSIACTGNECSAADVRMVKVGDYVFEFVPPPCVYRLFYAATPAVPDPVMQPTRMPGWCRTQDGHNTRGSIQLDRGDGDSEERQAACLQKCRAAGAVGCKLVWGQWNKGCYAETQLHGGPFIGSGAGRHYCWDFNRTGQYGRSYQMITGGHLKCPAGTEITSLKECEQAAQSLGLEMNNNPHISWRHWHRHPEGCNYHPPSSRLYYSIKSEIHATNFRGYNGVHNLCYAQMGVADDGSFVTANGHTKFPVTWLSGTPQQGTHVVKAETSAVFTSVPSKADALAQLKIGAWPPAEACSQCTGEVKVYGASSITEQTVFEIEGRFYRNVKKIVSLNGTAAMDNPPVYLRNTNERYATQQILAEVNALLDHLFTHPNTPVFLSKRMIQRFVTSNPSPQYVKAVGDAFKAGAYDGVTYSGEYGDLGAMVAAIILHPEARKLDTSHPTTSDGALREPMLKVMHLMRSMEYQDETRSWIVFSHLQDVIGQFPYNAPSVFNYYLADYQLPMPEVGAEPEPEPEPEPEAEPEPEPEPEASLVGPEFQIFTPPYLIGYLNGMSSLIKSGITQNCDQGKSLGISIREPDNGVFRNVCPMGSLTWPDPGNSSEAVKELDVMLTGGRMTPVAKEVVRKAYETAKSGEELKKAQQAAIMTAEFNTLGAPLPLAGARPADNGQGGANTGDYKAVIVLFMAGGADTWNMLVPQACNLYQEYRDIRTELTLEPRELHQITTTGQECTNFGIHKRFSFLKQLYDRKEAAFITNVGNLVEPTTLQTFRNGAARRCFNLFSHSDQQTGAQTLKCQELGTAAHGAGGRMADALAQGAHQYRTTSFSLAGSQVWSSGESTRREVVDERGTMRFHEYEEWIGAIDNISSQRHGNVYADAYADNFRRAVDLTNSMAQTLEETQLLTNYDRNSGLKRQLYQVAKLIGAREGRQAQRDFFFVSIGGWDMHANLKAGLDSGFGSIDDALRGFVAEMEAQNIWDSVLLTSASEFGRTLDSNGGGSDHAWAGQHFVIGGSIKGGKVLNKFPASLAAGNAYDLGRGRLIPEYPWESVLVPIAEWLGVETSQYDEAFPNLKYFNSSHLIPRADIFN